MLYVFICLFVDIVFVLLYYLVCCGFGFVALDCYVYALIVLIASYCIGLFVELCYSCVFDCVWVICCIGCWLVYEYFYFVVIWLVGVSFCLHLIIWLGYFIGGWFILYLFACVWLVGCGFLGGFDWVVMFCCDLFFARWIGLLFMFV